MYAIIHYSVTHIHEQLLQIFAKLEISKKELGFVEPHTAKIPKVPVLLFADIHALNKHAAILQGKSCLILVCDSLPAVQVYKNVQYLDSISTPDPISGRFRPQPLKLKKLESLIKLAVNQEIAPVNLIRQEFNPIQALITMVKQGMILDKINTLAYKTLDLKKREWVRLQIIRHLTCQLKGSDLILQLKKVFKRGQALTFIDELVEFLKSPRGDTYRQAMHAVELADGQCKIDELAAQYQIDQFELRYLTRLRNTLTTMDIPDIEAKPPKIRNVRNIKRQG